MTEAELQEEVRRLNPKQGRVYAYLLEHGPVADIEMAAAVDPGNDPGSARSRRSELAKMGLVRAVALEGRTRMWAVTPCGAVEGERDSLQARRPLDGRRVRSPREYSVKTRVATLLLLANDPEVQAELANPDAVTKRERSRLKKVQRRIEQDRRQRARDARDAPGDVREFIDLKNGLASGVDRVRSILALIEDELECLRETGAPRYSIEQWWSLLPDLLAEGVEHYERAYELVRELTGAPALPGRDEEIVYDEEIEDGEVEVEVFALIEAVAESTQQP